MALLILAFLGVTLFVPIGQQTPLVDEPIYVSSAFEFARSGDIQISNLSAPNAILDTVWGGLFALILGETYGALRLSTLVLTAMSAPFMYLLCRNLNGSRGISLLGSAAYLFAPLVVPLSVTFQTDMHFVSLIVMAVAFISFALTRERHQLALLGTGSLLVALAFLSRPQGLIVAIAALLIWLIRGPRGSGRYLGILAITAAPLMAFLVHAYWTSQVGEPFIRQISLDNIRSTDFERISVLGAQGLTEGMLYIGIFTLPFLPVLIAYARQAVTSHRRFAIYAGAAVGTIGIAVAVAGSGPLHLQAWFTGTGFGAVDRSFLGNRPGLTDWAQGLLVMVFAASAFALILALLERRRSSRESTLIGFVVLTMIGLAGGALISALAGHGRILDRYWAPIIPLAIALAVSVARSSIRGAVTAIAIVVAMGVVTVIGTADAFAVYQAAHEFAEDVVAGGIDPLSLDGGASWAAARFGLSDDDPDDVLNRTGPFWMKFYAVDSNPRVGIALEPLDGYTVIAKRPYRSILNLAPTYLYLLEPLPGLRYFMRAEDF